MSFFAKMTTFVTVVTKCALKVSPFKVAGRIRKNVRGILGCANSRGAIIIPLPVCDVAQG
jgi:hypothetical protein